MGGSTLGSDVIRSSCFGTLKVPFTIVNGYHLPAYVDKSTLVILSSYSGTTEEVLSAAAEARKRGALITGLTRGAKLGTFFRRNNYPWYQIDGEANPAGQPRMGLGYNVMGQIGLLAAAGQVPVNRNEIADVVAHLSRCTKALDPDVPVKRNDAKRLAASLYGRFPVLVGASHTVGSMHAFTNQLNETAKVFATYFPIPELNHHLLEGLKLPREVRRATFVFAGSNLYDPAIVKRGRMTREIVRRRGLRAVSFTVSGKSLLMQAMDVLVFAGYVSFYLSVLNGVNPLEIDTVNEFKKKLAR